MSYGANGTLLVGTRVIVTRIYRTWVRVYVPVPYFGTR